MGNIVENLNQINTIRENIKTSIVNKGGDLTGKHFEDYPSVIDNLPSGGGGKPFSLFDRCVIIGCATTYEPNGVTDNICVYKGTQVQISLTGNPLKYVFGLETLSNSVKKVIGIHIGPGYYNCICCITNVDSITFTPIGGYADMNNAWRNHLNSDETITQTQYELASPVTIQLQDGDLICATTDVTCLLKGTLILTPSGYVPIEELHIGDDVLSLNYETKQLEPRKIDYCDGDENKTTSEYDVWAFSDGTVIKTAYRHEFYNVENHCWKYLDEWNIGEHAINSNGEYVELVSHKNVKEECNHYTLFLEGDKNGYTNYYANGLLSGDRYCPKDLIL